MNCPVCDAPMRPDFIVHGHDVFRCDSCQHRASGPISSTDHVSAVYDDSYFQGGGAGYRDYPSEERILHAHGRRYGRLLRGHTRPGRVLDVGAAAGYVLQGLLDEGWTGVGLEPNRRMAELANRAGREVLVGTLEAPPEDLREKGPFDLVTMVQVVAHFHDLRRAFENAAALTKPGGLWLIETWDRSSWTARLFGRNWHEYSPPSVLHWFDRAGLAGLVSQFGMRTRAQGRPRKFISGGHARSLLRYKLEANALTRPLAWTTAVVPEHLPIPYPAEDLFWMLFQAAGKC